MPRAKFQIERKCKICGKPFMALTIESQYCSPACGQKAYKIRKREQKRNEELQQVRGEKRNVSICGRPEND